MFTVRLPSILSCGLRGEGGKREVFLLLRLRRGPRYTVQIVVFVGAPLLETLVPFGTSQFAGAAQGKKRTSSMFVCGTALFPNYIIRKFDRNHNASDVRGGLKTKEKWKKRKRIWPSECSRNGGCATPFFSVIFHFDVQARHLLFSGPGALISKLRQTSYIIFRELADCRRRVGTGK